uniref:Uncharacterized protein n=1 Tax=Glossina brevipalpis TaxID=37001 RepID=A0A1A9X309_9MUSC
MDLVHHPFPIENEKTTIGYGWLVAWLALHITGLIEIGSYEMSVRMRGGQKVIVKTDLSYHYLTCNAQQKEQRKLSVTRSSINKQLCLQNMYAYKCGQHIYAHLSTEACLENMDKIVIAAH